MTVPVEPPGPFDAEPVEMVGRALGQAVAGRPRLMTKWRMLIAISCCVY